MMTSMITWSADMTSCATSYEKTPAPSAQYKLVVDVYIISTLCVVGFVGNALSICILRSSRHERSGTTTFLLQTLAVVDTAYLLTCLFIQPIKTVKDRTDWMSESGKRLVSYIEPSSWALASTVQTMTVWMTLLVTVDRYVAVCQPWRVADFVSHRRRTRLAVALVLVTAILYNVPRYFERQVTVTRDRCSNSTSGVSEYDDDLMTVKVTKTALRDNRIYILVYKTICYLLFRAGGPLAALVVLNSRLLTTLRHQKRWRSSRQTFRTSRLSALHRQNVTAMLVTVVTVFIICELPDPALRLVYATVQLTSDPSGDLLLSLRYVNSITNALLAFNSSINFIIYFLVGRTFRRVFFSSFGCHQRQTGAAVNSTVDGASHSHVAMTTLRRRHSPEACTVLVAKDDVVISSPELGTKMPSLAVPNNSMTSHNHDQNHVTVVSVDVEK